MQHFEQISGGELGWGHRVKQSMPKIVQTFIHVFYLFVCLLI